MIMPDGSLRDSAYFSVIADEWPAVKAAPRGRAIAAERRRACAGSSPDTLPQAAARVGSRRPRTEGSP